MGTLVTIARSAELYLPPQAASLIEWEVLHLLRTIWPQNESAQAISKDLHTCRSRDVALILDQVTFHGSSDQGMARLLKSEGEMGQPLDPSQVLGLAESDKALFQSRYFLVGSWSDWNEFDELQRIFPGTNHKATVQVPSGLTSEFQIVRDRDFMQRFFPVDASENATIEGPASGHDGENWRIEVPDSVDRLEVYWDPAGQRRISWTFVTRCEEEQPRTSEEKIARLLDTSKSGGALRPLPWPNLRESGKALFESKYFLIGSWSDWNEYNELHRILPGPSHKASVQVPSGLTSEFQIVRDKDFTQRFFPIGASVNATIAGPANQHGENWRIEVPDSVEWLEVYWDPTGQRRVSWAFISQHQGTAQHSISSVGEEQWNQWRAASYILLWQSMRQWKRKAIALGTSQLV